MEKYYVNKNAQPNGDHEVHIEGCYYLKLIKNPGYLGQYTNCEEAVKEAKKIYPKSDGCKHCIPDCHKH